MSATPQGRPARPSLPTSGSLCSSDPKPLQYPRAPRVYTHSNELRLLHHLPGTRSGGRQEGERGLGKGCQVGRSSLSPCGVCCLPGRAGQPARHLLAPAAALPHPFVLASQPPVPGGAGPPAGRRRCSRLALQAGCRRSPVRCRHPLQLGAGAVQWGGRFSWVPLPPPVRPVQPARMRAAICCTGGSSTPSVPQGGASSSGGPRPVPATTLAIGHGLHYRVPKAGCHTGCPGWLPPEPASAAANCTTAEAALHRLAAAPTPALSLRLPVARQPPARCGFQRPCSHLLAAAAARPRLA